MGGPAASILGFAAAAVTTAKAAAAVVADKVEDHIEAVKGGKIRVYIGVENCGDGSFNVSGHSTAADADAVSNSGDAPTELNDNYIDIDPSELERV